MGEKEGKIGDMLVELEYWLTTTTIYNIILITQIYWKIKLGFIKIL